MRLRRYRSTSLGVLLLALASSSAVAGTPGPSFHLTHAPHVDACPTEKAREKRCILTEVMDFWQELRVSLGLAPCKALKAPPPGDPLQVALAHVRREYPKGAYLVEVSHSAELESAPYEAPAREIEMVVRRPGTSWLTRKRVVVADREGAWVIRN